MCKLTLTAGLCVIIAILGLPGLGVLADNICYGKADGDYYNPYDQHSFITCAHGIPYVKQCPGDLVYDTSIRVCNYPPQTPNGNLCDGRADGDYYNPYDQHSFITCAHGIAYIKQCPANLVYDTSIRVCNYPTQTHNGNLCDGRADGDYPHPYDLYSFITCAHGIAHIIECPSNLVYNPSIGVCDYPSNGNFCNRRRDGNYFNRDNRHSFISCSCGITYILACPSNKMYNPIKGVCDDPSDENFCKRTPDTTMMPTTTKYVKTMTTTTIPTTTMKPTTTKYVKTMTTTTTIPPTTTMTTTTTPTTTMKPTTTKYVKTMTTTTTIPPTTTMTTTTTPTTTMKPTTTKYVKTMTTTTTIPPTTTMTTTTTPTTTMKPTTTKYVKTYVRP